MKNHHDPQYTNQSDRSFDTGRRDALARMLSGGAVAGVTAASLPTTWTQPLVHSVLLPAHAQTTTEAPEPTEVPEDGNFAFPDTQDQSRGLLNRLVPTAHAQTSCVQAGCAALANGVVTVWVADSCGCCFSGSGNMGDSIEVTTNDSLCATGCAIPTIEIVELTENRVLKILLGDDPVELNETEDSCNCDAVSLVD